MYAQRVIVDETAIIMDLPPAMRTELVTHIYGSIVVAVPLFFGLDNTILAELCLALMPIPAMRGEIIVQEGTKGTEMYCLADGSARVTSRITSLEDEERIRIFIEEIFGANGEVIHLYKPGQKKLFTKVMRRAKQLALESKARVASLAQRAPDNRWQLGGTEPLVVSYRALLEDPKLLGAAQSTRTVVTPTQSIINMLKIAKKHKCIDYRGPLRITPSSPDGPSITLKPKETWPKIHWNSEMFLLCGSLRDGVILCKLLNTLLGNKKLPYVTSTNAFRTTVDLATNVTGAVVGATSAVFMDATDKAASVVPQALGGSGLREGVAFANNKQEAALGKVFDGSAPSASSSMDGLGDSLSRRNVELFLDALQDPEQEFNTGEERHDSFVLLLLVGLQL